MESRPIKICEAPSAPSVPWSIRRRDLDEPRVKQAVQAAKDYPTLTVPRDTRTLKIPGLQKRWHYEAYSTEPKIIRKI
jgi:hypothetical protein